MRRYVPLLIAGVALIAAACSDVVAPKRPSATPTLSSYAGGPGSWAAAVGSREYDNAVTSTFEILPGKNTQSVGEFTLEFDAGAVCDPATAGYGPDLWRQSCHSLGEAITITATAFTFGGRSYVEFSPDVRFSPDKDVTISVRRPEIKGKKLTMGLMLKYGIWYQTRVGNTRFFVDEAWSDPDLITKFDTKSGKVWRKIRHFSGVVIRTGNCDENPMDPSCSGGQ